MVLLRNTNHNSWFERVGRKRGEINVKWWYLCLVECHQISTAHQSLKSNAKITAMRKWPERERERERDRDRDREWRSRWRWRWKGVEKERIYIEVECATWKRVTRGGQGRDSRFALHEGFIYGGLSSWALKWHGGGINLLKILFFLSALIFTFDFEANY